MSDKHRYEKWDGGLLDLQPTFQREYVWQLKPEFPSRLFCR
jgi:hypothetical protein